MTIRNLDNFVGALWDWGILDGCFGQTRIAPTDVDGIVEHHGLFLVLEAKGETAKLQMGQRIMFDRLRATGLFTIVIIWGQQNKLVAMQVMTKDHVGERKPATIEDLRRVVSWWFQTANKNGPSATGAFAQKGALVAWGA